VVRGPFGDFFNIPLRAAVVNSPGAPGGEKSGKKRHPRSESGFADCRMISVFFL